MDDGCVMLQLEVYNDANEYCARLRKYRRDRSMKDYDPGGPNQLRKGHND